MIITPYVSKNRRDEGKNTNIFYQDAAIGKINFGQFYQDVAISKINFGQFYHDVTIGKINFGFVLFL